MHKPTSGKPPVGATLSTNMPSMYLQKAPSYIVRTLMNEGYEGAYDFMAGKKEATPPEGRKRGLVGGVPS